ncbi:kelch-like protein 10 [Antennarius striatus]|uniref:kelch-like protein 10 n=1 Tax=Antennarius striatus TaxID=241820 RepID=UPI0035B47F8A
MNDVRGHAGCSPFNKKIYIYGGNYLQSCEFYSPKTNQWTRFTNMSTRRGVLGVILYDNRIFALGGYDGHNYLRSVEAYDPETDQWNEIPPMLNNRQYCGTGVINDKLFVIGGGTKIRKCNSVEYYDAKTNTWTRARPMRSRHWGLRCCTVSNHPSMKQYTSRDTLPRLEDLKKKKRAGSCEESPVAPKGGRVKMGSGTVWKSIEDKNPGISERSLKAPRPQVWIKSPDRDYLV